MKMITAIAATCLAAVVVLHLLRTRRREEDDLQWNDVGFGGRPRPTDAETRSLVHDDLNGPEWSEVDPEKMRTWLKEMLTGIDHQARCEPQEAASFHAALKACREREDAAIVGTMDQALRPFGNRTEVHPRREDGGMSDAQAGVRDGLHRRIGDEGPP